MEKKGWARVLGAVALITAVFLISFFALCHSVFRTDERVHSAIAVFAGGAALSFILAIWQGPREIFIAGFVAALSSFLAATLSVHFGFVTVVMVVGLVIVLYSAVTAIAKRYSLRPALVGLVYAGEAAAVCLPMYLYL